VKQTSEIILMTLKYEVVLLRGWLCAPGELSSHINVSFENEKAYPLVKKRKHATTKGQ